MSDKYAEALKETEAMLAAEPGRINDRTLPLLRVYAEDQIELERKRFEMGDRAALLDAIRLCADHRVVMPDWVVQAFNLGHDKVRHFRTKSWDDAFGRPHPKGVHLAAQRKKRVKSRAVWFAVRAMHHEGASIDESTFAKVGRMFNLGTTLVAEYYYVEKYGLLGLAADLQETSAKTTKLP